MVALALALGSLTLSACASGATAKGMTISANDIGSAPSPRFAKSLGVAEVGGGKDTNPLWTSQIDNDTFKAALADSLQVAGLLGDTGSAPYQLKVSLVSLEQPFIGLDMRVTSKIRYVLTEAKSGAVVFDEEVGAAHTATVGDAFVGTKRLQLANEGSARKNIASFIEKLNALKLPAGAVAVPSA
jgi:hypothetical protein